MKRESFTFNTVFFTSFSCLLSLVIISNSVDYKWQEQIFLSYFWLLGESILLSLLSFMLPVGFSKIPLFSWGNSLLLLVGWESLWGKVVAAAAAKSLQSCPTLCDPIDGSPPGSCIPGILQARTLEWVAISCSSAWKWKVKVKSLGRVWLFATPWTAAHQAPPPMGFSRQEYWSGVPLPSPGKVVRLYQILFLYKLN